MLDIKFIRENSDAVNQNCIHRNVTVDIDKLLEMDEQRRDFTQQIDVLRADRNAKSKGKPSEEEILKMREVGEKIKQFEDRMLEIDDEYKILLMQIPNMTHPSSPIGGEEDFVVIEERGKKSVFNFVPKDHEELMTNLDMIDFERGAKVTGSKFYFAKNDLVRLNQALLNYGMDIATKHGFKLIETPDMAKEEILIGAGFNPRGEEDQIYLVDKTDFALIGTAEITTLGYHANEVLDLSQGPIKYLALSHCYRKEAGAYGKTSKGLYRVHQFTKLEMFIFCKPVDSEKLHEELRAIEQEICDGLKLPYRVIDIPTGDLGGPAYRKYDLEAWMVMNGNKEDGASASSAQGGYGEITSTSNCTDYQARRLNIKYKNEDGKNEFVHTLNGTAVVLSRFPIAIVENYQKEDGSIEVPEVLRGYMGKDVLSV